MPHPKIIIIVILSFIVGVIGTYQFFSHNPPAPNPTYDRDALNAEIDRISTHKPLGTTKSTLSYSNNGQKK